MDITVKTNHCDVPERVKDAALDAIRHATRYFDRLTTVDVVFREEPASDAAARAVVEVRAHTKGHDLLAEGVAADHRGALDVAVARFERQLAKLKGRLISRNRRDRDAESGPLPVLDEDVEDLEEDEYAYEDEHAPAAGSVPA